MTVAARQIDPAAERRIAALRQKATAGAIEAALADSHWAVRLAAAELAAACVEPERLVGMMAEGEDFARRASAVNALVRAGERAVPALLAALEGPPSATQVFCLQALSRIRCAPAFAALAAAARSPDALVSQAGLEGLGKQGDPRALPLLAEALGKDQWRALAAVVALGHLGVPAARRHLEPLLDDERFAEAARDALRRIERLEGGRS